MMGPAKALAVSGAFPFLVLLAPGPALAVEWVKPSPGARVSTAT